MIMQQAVIVQHCAVFGRLETRVRGYEVSAPRPYAQFPVSVSVVFLEPRQRRSSLVVIKPENIRYLTIEADGQTVYDSRTDVPCDMAQWAETDRRFKKDPAITVSGMSFRKDNSKPGTDTSQA